MHELPFPDTEGRYSMYSVQPYLGAQGWGGPWFRRRLRGAENSSRETDPGCWGGLRVCVSCVPQKLDSVSGFFPPIHPHRSKWESWIHDPYTYYTWWWWCITGLHFLRLSILLFSSPCTVRIRLDYTLVHRPTVTSSRKSCPFSRSLVPLQDWTETGWDRCHFSRIVIIGLFITTIIIIIIIVVAFIIIITHGGFG